MADQTAAGTFIPHDTVVTTARRSAGGLNDLLLLSGVVLLVASGALAIAVFLYNQYLQNESTSKLAQLQTAETAFQPSLIEQVTRLDDRMHAAQTILNQHIAPTAFFLALDQSTLQTVSFTSFDLEAPDAQHITIQAQGVAQSVNSIALQSDLFSKSAVITSPIFSNIARQPDGVHFDMTASVNASALDYESLVDGSAAGASAPQSAPAQQQQTSPFGTVPVSSQPAQTTPASSAQPAATPAGQ